VVSTDNNDGVHRYFTLGFKINLKGLAEERAELARRCFTQAQKLLILRRAGYKCQYCATPLTEENFEADHKIPFSKGGATEVWNALALCASCNRRKSDQWINDDVRF
jgi:5-methylcytosine-specific restriction endonuclease McrA